MRLAAFLALFALPAAAQDLTYFPYPVVAVPGAAAQAEWHRLRDEPGTAVIIGDADMVANLDESFSPEWAELSRSPAGYSGGSC